MIVTTRMRLPLDSHKQLAPDASDRSYRALLATPSMGRLLLGMQLARIAQSMLSVAIVLFALGSYGSSTLAGIATFFAVFPGLIVSPIAGALLDRHGRTRLVALDYLVALCLLTMMGMLALTNSLPAWLLVVIAGIASLTAPLSGTGLRSLFPLIVPKHLWERVNAIDSMGYIIATIIGPPLAAGTVALWGGGVAFMVIGISYGVAAVVIARTPDPLSPAVLRQPLLLEAWQGLVYTWRNRTLRGLGFCISVLNLGAGALTIIVPLIVLQGLHLGETMVGLVFAVQGITGILSAFLVGRQDSRGRERVMLMWTMTSTGIVLALLLLKSNIVVLVFVMALCGLLNGPLDIALFTIRQRRTDPVWTGRAFAVSMSFNALGLPVGSAIAGVVAARSIDAGIAFSVATCLLSGVLASLMIPVGEDE
jgi:MFS family permease